MLQRFRHAGSILHVVQRNGRLLAARPAGKPGRAHSRAPLGRAPEAGMGQTGPGESCTNATRAAKTKQLAHRRFRRCRHTSGRARRYTNPSGISCRSLFRWSSKLRGGIAESVRAVGGLECGRAAPQFESTPHQHPNSKIRNTKVGHQVRTELAGAVAACHSHLVVHRHLKVGHLALLVHRPHKHLRSANGTACCSEAGAAGQAGKQCHVLGSNAMRLASGFERESGGSFEVAAAHMPLASVRRRSCRCTLVKVSKQQRAPTWRSEKIERSSTRSCLPSLARDLMSCASEHQRRN